MRKRVDEIIEKFMGDLVELIEDKVNRAGGSVVFDGHINIRFVHGNAIDLVTIVDIVMKDGVVLVHNYITDGGTLDVDEYYTQLDKLKIDELCEIARRL